MKRMYIYRYITVLAGAALLAAACSEKEITDQEILEGRESESVKLEVSYASTSGTEVRSLSFTHSASREILQVNVNNENLKWDIESDRSWCKVIPEEHKGTGTVTLDIELNESFEAREPATLTFVAGEYRGFRISVSQTASAFIIAQPYFMAPISGGAFVTKVTTLEGADWNVGGESWLEVSEDATVTKDGYTTTTLTITPSENDGSSRYGSVHLTSGNETDDIWFYQFGTDLDYDTDGNILFPGDGNAMLSFLAPAFMVKSVQGPSFTKSSITENGDGTATITIELESNLSDCGEYREVPLKLQLSNASASIVELPAIMQDYIAAHGLVTGKGLTAYAKAIAAGASTADWESNGVAIVIQDIDMSEVSDWEGIGTADHPFSGQFDGGGHAITGLKNTDRGLFVYCNGATIQNITLGKGCSLYYNKDYSGLDGCLGGIVSVAEATTISGCGMSCDIEFAGSSENDEPAYIGGIVGWADAASSVKNAKMSGKLAISTPTSPDQICYVGGIAGLCEGSLTASEITGRINFSSGVGTLIAGGIEGSLVEGAAASNNSFMGAITLGGNSSNITIGGLYGSILCDHSFDSATDKSVSLGTITLDSYSSGSETRIFAGGFAGYAGPTIDLSFKDYEFQTNIALDQTVSRLSSYICLGGVLGGCDPDDKAKSVRFEGISNLGSFATAYTTSVGSQISRGFIGGIAGFINGASVFKSCNNNGEIGKLTADANCANTKNYVLVMGGIAGVVIGGDAEFSNCENKGTITNKHYSNCIPGSSREGWYTACTAAGILGAFDFMPDSEGGKLTMTGCVNGSQVVSYRGMAAGIVGYARNATISSCNNFGDLGQNSNNSSNAANKAGIACWISQTTVQDCIAKCNVFCSNPASAVQSPGGIVSVVTDGEVSISGCSYFGVISVNKGDQPLACGGILSTAKDDTVVKDCKYGGRVNGIDISENNVGTYAIGNEAGSVSGITLWNGNI